ncbi:MAG: methylated-DNA--[protein]-cysteine S-methyltransferase [Rickettsiales bacterium]
MHEPARLRRYAAPFGTLSLYADGDVLIRVEFSYGEDASLPQENDQDALLHEAARQLDAYFARRLRRFDLPLRPFAEMGLGAYQRALLDVPYGETLTYAELAEKIRTRRHARAAAQACARNPLPVFVPCHRIIGAGGKITGYGGGTDAKIFLLSMESGDA